MEEEQIITMEISIEALRYIYKAVKEAHERWPGGEPMEQENLEQLTKSLYVMLLDANYHTGNI